LRADYKGRLINFNKKNPAPNKLVWGGISNSLPHYGIDSRKLNHLRNLGPITGVLVATNTSGTKTHAEKIAGKTNWPKYFARSSQALIVIPAIKKKIHIFSQMFILSFRCLPPKAEPQSLEIF